MTLPAKTKSGICRLFVRAAKLMESGKKGNGTDPRSSGCCYAIQMASSPQDSHYVVRAINLLEGIFAPNPHPPFYFGPLENIEVRILALLFAARFVESGDADDL